MSELKTTDESFFIMKWGKFAALLLSIIIATNSVTGFMVSSELADNESKAHDIQVEKDKEYIEQRTKRRLARIILDNRTYVTIKFLEYDIKLLKQKLNQCKNK